MAFVRCLLAQDAPEIQPIATRQVLVNVPAAAAYRLWFKARPTSIAEAEHQVPIGQRRFYLRRPGDLLHPEREPRAVLDEFKRSMGSLDFAAQYQQQPVAEGGNLIKWDWFRFYQEPPAQQSSDRIIVSWDTAPSSKELSSYSACVVLQVKGDTAYVLVVIRERLEYPKFKTAIGIAPLAIHLNDLALKTISGRGNCARSRIGTTKAPPLQVFMTTHSPVVLKELSGDQLFVVRPSEARHEIIAVGTSNEIQGAIRLYPDAFLAPSVLVCEGASEVGLVRGVDQFRTAQGDESVIACGLALVDCGGGEPDKCFIRAAAFKALGYRTAVLRDSDIKPTAATEAAFVSSGGNVVAWRAGRALEDELFLSLTDDGVDGMIDRAIELHGEDLIDDHIKSASNGTMDLAAIRRESDAGGISVEMVQIGRLDGRGSTRHCWP